MNSEEIGFNNCASDYLYPLQSRLQEFLIDNRGVFYRLGKQALWDELHAILQESCINATDWEIKP